MEANREPVSIKVSQQAFAALNGLLDGSITPLEAASKLGFDKDQLTETLIQWLGIDCISPDQLSELARNLEISPDHFRTIIQNLNLDLNSLPELQDWLKLADIEFKEKWVERHTLSSGRVCALKIPNTQLVPAKEGKACHLLAYFPKDQGEATAEEKLEMIDYATRVAWKTAQSVYGDMEAYSLLHNGRGNTRIADFHVHIFILNSGIDEVFRQLWEKNKPKLT